jgi:ribonuclease T2
MQKIIFEGFNLLCLSLSSSLILANSCVDNKDSFSQYNETINDKSINNIPSQYYVLSYSWAASHCAKVSSKSKEPGSKNYLQCHSNATFDYILHGLWPQGDISGTQGYPRACAGDQGKIPRQVLSKYLCMTPSVWLLQHEYENHGTCMPTSDLKTPQGYLGKAKQLHDQLVLPSKQLSNTQASFQWWYSSNPQLAQGALQYASKSREWQVCYDQSFRSMICPVNSGQNISPSKKPLITKSEKDPKGKHLKTRTAGCAVKGNISKKSLKKWYFIRAHPQFEQVRINTRSGERCFKSEFEATEAGWKKAR